MNANLLYYGDNLDILRKHIDDESVDLIYIDPPFNSARAYNVIFDEPNGSSSQAQIRAFSDTWHWTVQTAQTYEEILDKSPPKLVECIRSFRSFLGETNMMAYLVMMAPRIVEDLLPAGPVPMLVQVMDGGVDGAAPALAHGSVQRLDALEPEEQGLGAREVRIDLPLVVRAFQSDHGSSPFDAVDCKVCSSGQAFG